MNTKNFALRPNLARAAGLTLAATMLLGSTACNESKTDKPNRQDLVDSVKNAFQHAGNLACTPSKPLGAGPVSDRLKLLFPDMANTSVQQVEATKQSATQIEASKPTPDTAVEACHVNLLDNHGGRQGEATIAFALDNN